MEKTNFYIHFDLNGGKHSIPIHQSIIKEQAVEKIINNIKTVVFEGKIDVEIFIEPPKEGGYKTNILLVVSLLGNTFNFFDGNIGSSYIEGLTGKSVTEYSKDLGIKTSEILKDSTIGFFSKNSHDLVESGICIDKFYDAYEAKNNFYKSAIANKDILGLGFCSNHTFPIDKGLFYYKTIELKKEKTGKKFVDKYHDLLVISSINSEENKYLQWKVEDKISKEKFGVNIGDNEFYKIYFTNNLMIREFKVRLRYYISIDNFGEENIEKKEIVMVYEYNNSYKLMLFLKNKLIEPAPYKLPEKYNGVENQMSLIS